MKTCTSPRERRNFRYAVAKVLSSLLEESSDTVIDVSDWMVLDQLPAWCTADSVEIRKIAELCGALSYTDQIKKSVNGVFLREIENVIGYELIRRVQQVKIAGLQTTSTDSSINIQNHLMIMGLSILLETIQNNKIKQVFMTQHEVFNGYTLLEPSENVEADLAWVLYVTAVELIDCDESGGGVIGTGESHGALEKQLLEAV